MTKDIELSDIEYSYLKMALLKGIKVLCGVSPHGNPSYYDLCKWLGFNASAYRYYSDDTEKVVSALHKMEKEGLIVGEGAYYKKGTHSGAGAKKWRLAE